MLSGITSQLYCSSRTIYTLPLSLSKDVFRTNYRSELVAGDDSYSSDPNGGSADIDGVESSNWLTYGLSPGKLIGSSFTGLKDGVVYDLSSALISSGISY
jgi:hypothetical protein